MELPIHLSYFVDLLREILTGRIELIRPLQTLVWNRSGEITGFVDLDEKLRELVLDLDYFESDAHLRAEGANLYGHERLAQEVQAVLRDLEIELAKLPLPKTK